MDATPTRSISDRHPARSRLVRSGRTNLPRRASAPAALETVDTLRARLLYPSKHMGHVVEKLHYFLQASENAEMRDMPLALKPWLIRLLHSILKDATELADEFERYQREDSLRKHADSLSDRGKMAALLEQTTRELNEALAERDAALSALERANAMVRPQPARPALPI